MPRSPRARRRPTEGQPSTRLCERQSVIRARHGPASVISLRFRHRDSKKTRARVGGVGRQTTDGPCTPRRCRAVSPQSPDSSLPSRRPRSTRVWRAHSRARETQSAKNRAERVFGDTSRNDQTAASHGRACLSLRAKAASLPLVNALPRGTRIAAKAGFTGAAAYIRTRQRSQKPRSARHASSSSTQAKKGCI
jgi:hypothetical protein